MAQTHGGNAMRASLGRCWQLLRPEGNRQGREGMRLAKLAGPDYQAVFSSTTRSR